MTSPWPFDSKNVNLMTNTCTFKYLYEDDFTIVSPVQFAFLHGDLIHVQTCHDRMGTEALDPRPASKCIPYTLLKSKRHSLRCHDFLVHAYLLRMCTNVVDFRVMRRLCRREWNWQRNWQSVNQHSWDPWQWTRWSRRVTSDFNSVLYHSVADPEGAQQACDARPPPPLNYQWTLLINKILFQCDSSQV